MPECHRCLFTCVALTGVRFGELLALQWKHINFQSKTLKIEQSLWQGQIVPPKTRSSVRSIPLGDILVRALETHRRISTYTRPDDFVFCNSDGKWLHPDVLRKDVLYPALDRLNIPRINGASGFHAFRHSAASLINAETGNQKLTQRFLGHSDVNTTANIYTHTTEEMEREATIVLEKAIFGNLCPIVPVLETGHKNTIN